MDYLVWKANPVGGYCTLETLENVDDSFELKRGISRSTNFPKDAKFSMDASHPKEVKLSDNIMNLEGMVVVSKQLKEFIELKNPKSTEFLQVTILNHKGKVASTDYFIVNPFIVQDCIDTKNSKIRWNVIDKQLISSCTELTIFPEKIDQSLLLFRPKYMPVIVMVRSDLVKEIKDRGFTGLRFKDIEDFEL